MASVAGRGDGLPPLRLIVWPYHGGQRGVGMGAGASKLAEDAGVLAALARPGWRVCTEHVLPVDESRPEIWRVFELARRLAERVRAARAEGALPVVLAGNCCSCLGTVSGVAGGDLGAADLGAVWLDAHA